jgi:hypothetical protein
MIPRDAKLESSLSSSVALYDVAHLLKRKSKQDRRDVGKIVRVYHHHSGADGRDGFDGLAASARYVVDSRGFPGPAYTYWLSFAPDKDEAGRLVVYRCNPDEIRSWHTGAKANEHGIAIAWQGNLGARKPSAAQREMAEALMAYVVSRHALTLPLGVSFHAEANKFGGRSKPSCPGVHVTEWVREYRERTPDICPLP